MMGNIAGKLFKYLFDKETRLSINISHGFYGGMSDEAFLRMLYKRETGKELNLENPGSFTERIQWLKLYDHNPLYHILADKIAVKEYVASKIGWEHIIRTIGVWDRFDEIDFNALPERFVLKCNHNSGNNVIVRDRKTLDTGTAGRLIGKSLACDYYKLYREWAYKGIARKVFAEEYLDAGNKDLIDYKFFCFNGVPKFINVSRFPHSDAIEISLLTPDWELTPYQRAEYRQLSISPEKPGKLGEMLDIARTLSEGIPFVRVDLYEVDGTVYFGELTFYPTGGFVYFSPEEWNETIGSWINLPDPRE